MDFFQSVAGGLVLTLAGLALYGALLAWARRPGHADRLPALVAATGMGLVVAVANLGAQALGWWGGHWSYAQPAPLQASFWVLWITPVMTFSSPAIDGCSATSGGRGWPTGCSGCWCSRHASCSSTPGR